MVDKDKILQVVKAKGPILPVHIKREIEGSDTLTIGAVLSELAREEKIIISKTKIGGSPVYYISEQKAKLQDLREHLNDKQQKAFDSLKQKKILKDSEQEPVIRASLRDIKDFAKPLEVTTPEGRQIYWKWYLTPNDEAKNIIRKDLNIVEKQKTLTEPEKQKESSDEEKKEPKKESVEEAKEYSREETNDDFLLKIRRFFEDNHIEILEENSVRKGSELEFIVLVPTHVGNQKYFCKARNKKKCNDGDLSSAYIQGQMKRIPVLFIYTGEITNKAEDMLDEEFQGMLVKKV